MGPPSLTLSNTSGARNLRNCQTGPRLLQLVEFGIASCCCRCCDFSCRYYGCGCGWCGCVFCFCRCYYYYYHHNYYYYYYCCCCSSSCSCCPIMVLHTHFRYFSNSLQPKTWSTSDVWGTMVPIPILSWLVKNRNCQFMQYFSLVHWLRSLRAPEESGRFLMFLSSIRLPATNVHPLFSLKPRRFFNWCNYVKLVTTFSLTGAGLNILNSPFWSRVMLD